MSDPTGEKTLVLYHGGCDDGFGGALAAWLRLGDTAEYVGLEFGKDPPDVRGRHVVMIDFFPYGREWLERCGAETLLILDHHKTAAASVEGVARCPMSERIGTTKVSVVFDMNRSGATIAWSYFHPNEPVPEFFRYLEDRDLFRNALPDAAEWTMALRSYEQDFEVWRDFLEEASVASPSGVERLIQEGRAINRFYQRKCREVAATAARVRVGEVEVPVVSCPWFMGSDVCAILAKGEAFALYWYTRGDDVVWGARSDRDGSNVDVSAIARGFGGGGHHNAAGWVDKGGAKGMRMIMPGGGA